MLFCHPWILLLPLPSTPTLFHFSSLTNTNRRFMASYLCRIKSSALQAHGVRADSEGRWKFDSYKSDNKLNSYTSIHVPEKMGNGIWMKRINSHSLGPQAKRIIQSMSLHFILRVAKMGFLDQIMKVIQATLPYVFQTLSATSLPLACVSNALSNPTPLRLEVSLPSFHDIGWSLARLLYLFNIRLERNVAIFFVVLLVACFVFVVIGGLLFFQFRDSEQSLEDCVWDAWACFCSSSTHLELQTRTERAIGFVLAIWGVLFYSRLLSTMTEEFRDRIICKNSEREFRCKSWRLIISSFVG